MKRWFDLAVGLIVFIGLLPIFVVVSILVYIKLGSPVVFKQQRPGIHKKPFVFYKFRTMTNEKDTNGNLLPNSERLTSFGLWLRKSSLDELPSLFNVILGDLSLVGPRPLRLKYNDCYSKEQDKRHVVKPGITGLAQVNGRTAITWEEKFNLDCYYVKNQSFWLDLKIIFRTIGVVLIRKNTNNNPNHFEVPFDEYMKQNAIERD